MRITNHLCRCVCTCLSMSLNSCPHGYMVLCMFHALIWHGCIDFFPLNFFTLFKFFVCESGSHCMDIHVGVFEGQRKKSGSLLYLFLLTPLRQSLSRTLKLDRWLTSHSELLVPISHSTELAGMTTPDFLCGCWDPNPRCSRFPSKCSYLQPIYPIHSFFCDL